MQGGASSRADDTTSVSDGTWWLETDYLTFHWHHLMTAITSLTNLVPFNGVEITVSPFHQKNRHLFDVSRCFVFTLS